MKPDKLCCLKVVLADFGLAAYIADRKRLAQRCGSGGFLAPEIFQDNWNMTSRTETAANLTKIDVFSFGMLIYTAILGNNPLVDVTSTSTVQRNVRASLSPSNMAIRSDELHYLLSGLCATSSPFSEK